MVDGVHQSRKLLLDSLMKTENADVNKLDIINAGDADFFTMVKKDVDFAWIYYAWTGVEAELRGEKLNMVYLTDYSDKLDYYTPVLATNENMISKDPETVKAFVAGAAKGYDYAINEPDKAADILIKAEPDLNAELVKKSQEWLADKYQDDAKQWGEQKLEVWENYADWMSEHGVLEGKFEAEKAFTNEFLPQHKEENNMANSLVSAQIIPKTKGEDIIPFVDAAIAIIAESGVKYEVHPLETTMEGELSVLLEIIQKMNEKMMELGCVNVITQVKILYQPQGITMDTLTEKYR